MAGSIEGAGARFRDGRVALAGNFWGTTAIGEGSPHAVEFTSSGKWDFLLAVYDAAGEFSGAR